MLRFLKDRLQDPFTLVLLAAVLACLILFLISRFGVPEKGVNLVVGSTETSSTLVSTS